MYRRAIWQSAGVLLSFIASAEYPAACRGDEGVGNEAVYKNLKDTLNFIYW